MFMRFMYVNIAVTVIYVFVVFLLLYYKGKLIND